MLSGATPSPAPRSFRDTLGPVTFGLARRLNLFDAAMIVVAGIVGVGIFNNPRGVAARVETPFLIIAVWLAGGLIALAGAFVFAELARSVPRAGGQYAYFREAFGPLPGFLYGWSLLFIVQSGATGAVAISCGDYAVRLLGLGHEWAARIAVALLAVLVGFHALGIKPGSVLINILTVVKMLAIAALVVGGFALVDRPGLTPGPVLPPGLGGLGLLSAFFAGLVPAMFAYGGWQNSCFVVEEVREPERNLPRAIIAGVVLVIVIYLGANLAYLHVLGATKLSASQVPAADFAEAIAGPAGAAVVSALTVLSAFGFLNLALMTAPRVYFAMARDGLFFATAAKVSPRTRAPVVAVVVQGALAAAFTISHTYDALVDFAVFADWVFFSLAAVALLVFRRRRRRPVSLLATAGAVLFIVAGLGIVAGLFVAQPLTALIGSAVLAAGVPAYFLWRRFGGRR